MIYFIAQQNLEFVKIGYTRDSLSLCKRISVMQVGNPHKLIILGVVTGGIDKEQQLHKVFKAHAKRGEWFKVSGTLKAYIYKHFFKMPVTPVLDHRIKVLVDPKIRSIIDKLDSNIRKVKAK